MSDDGRRELTLYWTISSIGSTHRLRRQMAGLKMATPHCNRGGNGGNGGMACVLDNVFERRWCLVWQGHRIQKMHSETKVARSGYIYSTPSPDHVHTHSLCSYRELGEAESKS